MHNYLSFYVHSLALIFRCAAPLRRIVEMFAINIPVRCTCNWVHYETESQATAWRNIDRINGQYEVWR